jgi:hypothetical protein
MSAATIEPEIAFRRFSAAAIHAALTDPHARSPIAREVARLAEHYAAAEHHPRPRWPIEVVAMEMASAAIRAAIAEHHGWERAVLVRSIMAEFPAEDAEAWRKVVGEAVSRAYADGMTLEEWRAAAVNRLRLSAKA